ncbi:MAG: hypothetical protein ACFFG0_32490 [Candidatus Thorarchaeota archaeon]
MVKRSSSYSDGSKRRQFKIKGKWITFYSRFKYLSMREAKKYMNIDIDKLKKSYVAGTNKSSIKGNIKQTKNTTFITLQNGFPLIMKVVKEGDYYRYYSNSTVDNHSHYERYLEGLEKTPLPYGEGSETNSKEFKKPYSILSDEGKIVDTFSTKELAIKNKKKLQEILDNIPIGSFYDYKRGNRRINLLSRSKLIISETPHPFY